MGALKRVILEYNERKLWAKMIEAHRRLEAEAFVQRVEEVRRELLRQGGTYSPMVVYYIKQRYGLL